MCTNQIIRLARLDETDVIQTLIKESARSLAVGDYTLVFEGSISN